MKKTKAFDSFALEYDEWFESHKIEYEQEINAIKMLLPAEGHGLEVGAGTGRFTARLGISLGVEPSQAMRDVADSQNIKLVEGNAESLPCEDGSYDYALLVTVDCFLDDMQRAFREVHRVIKPGGSILIGMIDKNSKLGKKYQEQKAKSRFYKEATFHAIDEIQDQLNKAGFNHYEFAQALLPGDVNEKEQVMVKPGYGEGSFVVIRAQKN